MTYTKVFFFLSKEHIPKFLSHKVSILC